MGDEAELIKALLKYTHDTRKSNLDRIELCKSALSQNATEGFGNVVIQRKVYWAEIDACTQKMRASEQLVDSITQSLSKNSICVACMKLLPQKRLLAPCNHTMCETCSEGSLSQCPACRESVTSSSLKEVVVETPGSSEVTEEEALPDKLTCLIDIVTTANPEAKILLFSKHVRVYRRIQDMFSLHNVTFGDLAGGSQAHIDSVIRDFKQGNTKVLMVDPSLFACGLDIQNTTDVIMLHKMDEHTERQVVGRAQRPGRTGRLSVWYILNANEWDSQVPATKS